MTKTIKIYPRAKALRKRCLGCATNSVGVNKCHFKTCQLWLYRLKSSGLPKGLTSVARKRAIASYCLDFCCLGSLNEVKKCPSQKCPLWPYRFVTKKSELGTIEQVESHKNKNQ